MKGVISPEEQRGSGAAIARSSRARPLTYEVTPNGCHICTSHACSPGGYPKTLRKVGDAWRPVAVHRVVYEHHYGAIPPGLVVRHKCDNPPCINPEHLEVGTHADNMRDRTERGRCPKGEDHWKSKLTVADVVAIRESTENAQVLAERYGVTKPNIAAVRNGKIWKDVPGPITPKRDRTAPTMTGRELREYREAHGVTATQVALRAGRSLASICKFEVGSRPFTLSFQEAYLKAVEDLTGEPRPRPGRPRLEAGDTENLERLATAWKCSKPEAVRRAVREALAGLTP